MSAGRPARALAASALLALIALLLPAASAAGNWRRPTAPERRAIVRDIGWAWRNTDAFVVDSRRGRHPAVDDIRVSRSDRHFARADVHPLNRQRKQVAETGVVALMQATGRWLIVIGPMTDYAVVCRHPAPVPIRELFC
jgi:hypothetical protein